ncbi:hypothetical protein F4561_005238 [Lipingzhangella halophila]|uniref:Vegetative cell wall protein gp1 n=1 Tax=Lipingzhangella halophila TaxID=1783352 RepID=A0A7W7RMP9_9ACTN|nr:hypothetical protein [Lipingzhangella halophila]MBB4934418.1 hypothetical protein [Lipingzhangella halophila]
MSGLLATLGTTLTERWVSLLALPGILYLAVAATARMLGHAHALDPLVLVETITAHAENPRVATVGGQVTIVAAVLAGSAALGLLARALGGLIEGLWLAADWQRWPPPLPRLIHPWVATRRHRWATRRRTLEAADRSPEGGNRDGAGAVGSYRAAYDQMARVSAEEPERPTWCGDRINAVARRLRRDHDLDVAVVWPHLWLILPSEVATPITTARQDVARAVGLAAWAVLYLPLAVWWWPSALITVVLGVLSWWKTRRAIDTYATLIEATIRLHTGELAHRLGIKHTGLLTPQVGEDLTRRLQASLPPAPTTPPTVNATNPRTR